MDRQDMLAYLSRRGLVFKDFPEKVSVLDCPFCKPTYGRADNQWKLAIFPNGGYNCVRCGSAGSWYDFKRRLGDLPSLTNAAGNSSDGAGGFGNYGSGSNGGISGSDHGGYTGSNYDPSAPGPARGRSAAAAAASAASAPASGPAEPLSQSEAASWAASLDSFPDVVAYLTGSGPGQRGLSRAVIDLYNVGAKLHQFPAPASSSASAVATSGAAAQVPGDRGGALAGATTLAQLAAAADGTAATVVTAASASASALTRAAAGAGAGAGSGASRWVNHPCITFPWARAPRGALKIASAKAAGKRKTIAAAAAAVAPGSPDATDVAAADTASATATAAAAAAASADLSAVPPCPQNLAYDRVKVRSTLDKSCMRILPKGGDWGFFGWHTIPDDCTELVITEGEFDAMAVRQATGHPAVSLPNGCRSFPVQLLPCLERFSKIILWLDDDGPGRDGADAISRKLGMNRCLIVGPAPADALPPGASPPKDANDALRAGADLKKILSAAQPCSHKEITSFPSFRNDVRRMFTNPNEHVGVSLPNMPRLQSLVKGHRRGELSIFTGPTGVGKTTILAQLSLEICQQNVPTLWGSFEIRNPRLVRTLMMQYAAQLGVTLNPSHAESFDYVADRFQELPMHFLKFYGSSPVQEVLDAMDYAVYVHDVQHIILDNLQFMLSGQGKSGIDKFDVQDRAIEAFRQFASQRNVHVSLVIHPRKEADNSSLGISSIFGSAKATQEADNVFIIQSGLPRAVTKPLGFEGKGKVAAGNRPDLSQHGGFDDPLVGEVLSTFFRTLELRKNRWDGDLGAVPLRFDRASNRLFELTSTDVQTGLVPFVEKHRKLKQMDLITHMHQNASQGSALGMRDPESHASAATSPIPAPTPIASHVATPLHHGHPGGSGSGNGGAGGVVVTGAAAFGGRAAAPAGAKIIPPPLVNPTMDIIYD